MARIENMMVAEMSRNSVHESVEATYAIFQTSDGETYLQVDTYGSPGRAIPGKKSQSIQFGPNGIAQLKQILEEIG
jgi:hypothetical protein